MVSEQLAPTLNISSTINFHIDAGMGKDTTVSIMSKSSLDINLLLSGPSNFTRTQSGVSVQPMSLLVPGVIQVIK